MKSFLKILLLSSISVIVINAKAISVNQFNKVVNQKGLVVVEVWAPWCGNCTVFKPIYNSVKHKLSSFVKFYEVNGDKVDDPFTTFGIQYGYPSLLLYKDGVRVDTKEGGMSQDEMISWINQYR